MRERCIPRAGSGVLALLLACIAATAAELPKQKAGPYQVTLRVPASGLYAREEVQIEFRIEDTSRPDPLTDFAPVVRAVPEAVIDMPQMSSMPKFTETAHAEGVPGDYGIHPSFAHGGAYRLTLAIRPPGGEAFTVEFPLAVKDADPRRKPPPPRYALELTSKPKKPRAGEEAPLRLTIRDRDNPKPSFEMVHEALMHLVIVRRDLAQFGHEHPVLDADGTFSLTYRFPTGGDYHLFADVAPKGAGSQILMAKIAVTGSPTAPAPQALSCTVEMLGAGTPLPSRTTVPVAFRLRTSEGRPVTNLQPYLGVAGHLMMVHEDAVTFVHSHPGHDLEPQTGEIRFLSRLPKPGRYRAWLQFRRGGRVETAEFAITAGEGQ